MDPGGHFFGPVVGALFLTTLPEILRFQGFDYRDIVSGLILIAVIIFILYWLWRDISALRTRVGLSDFPAGGYVAGAIFLAPVAYSFVLVKLNEYWDARTQGLATEAPVSTGEKVAVGIGAAFLVLWVLLILVGIIVAISTSGSSN